MDNLFVFVLIMGKFAVPSQYQQRVLMVGVLVALVLRAGFIAAGAAIISTFSWVFYVFGAFLIWTAWKLVQDARRGHENEEYEENKLLKIAERRFGVADRYHGTKLFIRENGKRVMTPMLVVMLAIGSTDVLFALDSIPAIYGLTQDPYIVFTANAFALMGLRQLYFLIGGLLKKLVHLSYGLSIILGFIGVKLVLHALHESGVHVPEISILLARLHRARPRGDDVHQPARHEGPGDGTHRQVVGVEVDFESARRPTVTRDGEGPGGPCSGRERESGHAGRRTHQPVQPSRRADGDRARAGRVGGRGGGRGRQLALGDGPLLPDGVQRRRRGRHAGGLHDARLPGREHLHGPPRRAGDRCDVPQSGAPREDRHHAGRAVRRAALATLGIRAAWYDREHHGLGVHYPPLAERFERLEETLRICLQMWDPEANGPFEGKHYRLAETLCVPAPVSSPHPEIMIGGGGEKKTLRLVAQYADACNLIVSTPDELRHKLSVLRGHCDTLGRDYDRIRKTIVHTGESVTTGDLDAFLREIDGFSKLGVDTVILGPRTGEPTEWIERFVAPAVPRLAELD